MSARTELIKALEDQGFTWRTTARGHVMVYAPDGGAVTTLPGTTSDWRSLKNCIAQLRRSGFEWKGR